MKGSFLLELKYVQERKKSTKRRAPRLFSILANFIQDQHGLCDTCGLCGHRACIYHGGKSLKWCYFKKGNWTRVDAV